jgi:hypothetical protein
MKAAVTWRLRAKLSQRVAMIAVKTKKGIMVIVPSVEEQVKEKIRWILHQEPLTDFASG